jgi:hypothetical protein
MKKISIVLFSVIMALSASAQKVVVPPRIHTGPRVVYYYPRPYFYNPYYFGFNYWYGQPAYYYTRPTKLERQIQDTENEYSDRISSVRADDSLSGHDRRAKIRDLRHERDQAIDDLKKNYYKQYEN